MEVGKNRRRKPRQDVNGNPYPPAKRGKYWKLWIERDLASATWRRPRDLYCRMIIDHGYPLTQEQLKVIGSLYTKAKGADVPHARFLTRFYTKDRDRYPFREDILKRLSEMVSEDTGRDLNREHLELLTMAIDKAKESGDFNQLEKAVAMVDKYTRNSDRAILRVEQEAQKGLPQKKEILLLDKVAQELDDEEQATDDE